MASTLDDVTIELIESNEKLDIIKNHTMDTNEYLLLTVDTFTTKFNELIDFFTGNSLKEIEQRREEKEYQNDLLEAIEGIELTQAQQDVKIAEGFLDSLARLGVIFGGIALAVGAAAGAFTSFLKNLKAIGTLFKSLFKSITPAKIAANLVKVFDSIGDFLKLRLGAAGGAFGTAISSIVGFFARIGEFFKASIFKIPGVKGVVDTISRAMATIGTMIKNSKTIVESVSKVGGMLGAFKSVFGLIFKFVSRIFAPLYTLYETIVGIWKGYEDGGFIGAIKGGIIGFFKGFIGDFLNIITGAAAWIAGALGFDKVEKALSSIDFNQIFGNLVNTLFNTVTDTIDFFKNQLGFSDSDSETQGLGEKVKSFAIGLITLPYALIQKAISDVTSLLGFDELSEKIESFSFKDTLTGLVNKVPEIVEKTINRIKTAFDDITNSIKEFDLSEFISGASDMASNFFKKLLRGVLPDPNSMKIDLPSVDTYFGTIGGGSINLNPIPDSMYEFAGMNPTTGALTKPPQSGGGNSQGMETITPEEFDAMTPSEQVAYNDALITAENPVEVSAPNQKKAELLGSAAQSAEIEKQMMQMQIDSAGGGGAGGGGNVTVIDSSNKSTNTVNEFKPSPSPVRPPNSPSDALWNMGGNFAP